MLEKFLIIFLVIFVILLYAITIHVQNTINDPLVQKFSGNLISTEKVPSNDLFGGTTTISDIE
ncbi:MAG: hypothetical protein KAR54_02795 [Candidatus Pacebacteria bacterium]|nr:hypothetical protein [Candidatus Paceibacterota bacterium]